MSANAADHYREQQILNASPAERIVLLYDGAIKFMMLTKKAIEDQDIQARFDNSVKAKNIIQHLSDTLDMDKGGEIASNLDNIYTYLLHQFLEIDKNKVEAVDEVIKHLKILRESWDKIATGEREGEEKPIDNIVV